MNESESKGTHDTTSVPPEVTMSTRYESELQPTEQETEKQSKEEDKKMEESNSKRTHDSISVAQELPTCKKHKNEVELTEQMTTQENMESSASESEHDSLPKALPTEGCLPGFGNLLNDLKNALTRDTFRKLASALDFTPVEREKVETSWDPGHSFVHSLKEKGIIRETDISVLIEKLNYCGLHNLANDVNESFKRYQSQTEPHPTESQEYKEKKAQFVKELKNGYEKQCGGFQPVSFLRYKDKISKLFVEGGIKLIEKTHEESTKQEKLVELGKYNTMFIHPKAKSKKRIIEGGPGYGKSTLALQITHDWCHEKEWMNKFEILILLRLKEFKNVPSVYSAIKAFLLPKDTKLTENDIKSILKASSTVILLEGYNEYPDRENEDTDINHIIRGDMFQEHEVILTTRTSCLPPNHENANIKHFRLTGFDETSRETYFQNVVAPGCSDNLSEIRIFLVRKMVPADFCEIPLVFSMVCYMLKISERFRNVQKITEVYRNIIRCFQCHSDTKGNRVEELDHSELDQIAFEGLVSDTQQISWDKNYLKDKIGEVLYDEYVRFGILIEEVEFHALNPSIRTKFFHKLFAQWYAAHYLAKAAAQPEAEFEKWPEYSFPPLKKPNSQGVETSQTMLEAATKHKVYPLRSQTPHYVHYMYQFACGLNDDAAVKIIKHLGTNELYDEYTLSCIAQWFGDLKKLESIPVQLCSRGIHVTRKDSYYLAKGIMDILAQAKVYKIFIPVISLHLCTIEILEKDEEHGGFYCRFCVSETGVYLPVMKTLGKIVMNFEHCEYTYEWTKNILMYAGKCEPTEVWFYECLLPRSMKRDDIPPGVKVEWVVGVRRYRLNRRTGNWQDTDRGIAMTDERYIQERNAFGAVGEMMFCSDPEDSEESDA